MWFLMNPLWGVGYHRSLFFVVCCIFPFFPILIFNETIFNFIIIKRNTLSEDELLVSGQERPVGGHRPTGTRGNIPLLTPVIAGTPDSEGKIVQTYSRTRKEIMV